jgi:hypothetical protein
MALKNMRKAKREYKKARTVIAGVQKVQIKDRKEPGKG